MRRTHLVVPALALALGVAGCGHAADGGGDADTAGTDAAAPPADTRATLPAEPTVEAPPATFPAATAADVVALAAQRPPGKVRYEVAAGDDAWTLEVARDATRGRLHRVVADAETWVGVDVAGRALAWVCERRAGGSASCRSGDPAGVGARTAAQAAELLGTDAIRRTFAPAVALPETGVGIDTQAGQQVSCLAVTTEGRDLRLCVSAEGIITQMTAGTTTARATAVASNVLDADLQPPAPPR